jgi:OOP family OmpA-OmpF porin
VTLDSTPGCADKAEVRFYHWAWNAQSGLMLATGGKQATQGSLMCKNGVNLKLIREDNVETMQSLMLSFAEQLKNGENNPEEGARTSWPSWVTVPRPSSRRSTIA